MYEILGVKLAMSNQRRNIQFGSMALQNELYPVGRKLHGFQKLHIFDQPDRELLRCITG